MLSTLHRRVKPIGPEGYRAVLSSHEEPIRHRAGSTGKDLLLDILRSATEAGDTDSGRQICKAGVRGHS